ncbi:MAG: potassium uptake protein, TrkH family [Dehalococcoidia bacterium]|nr:potassium uptake protein, TrkH family [Dehalococcoidia bacterium]
MVNIKSRRKLSPAAIFALGFLAVITVGTILLSLPFASSDSNSVPLLVALFTSVSATCVTGLTLTDTAQTWSVFGQIVILCLVQIGGLGFMSITTIFFFVVNKKMGLSFRLLIVQSLSLKDMQGVIQLVRHILIGALLFEGLGAVILWIRFLPVHGMWDGLKLGIFHAVSAFCNAGFGIIGTTGELSGFSAYSEDVFVTITLMLLVIIGGLGFFVWEDIWRNHRFTRLHLHSKLVLTMTFWIIVAGTVFFYVAERTNPSTLGNMSLPSALAASLFQAVVPKTAGFSIINQSSLSGVSLMILMMLMLIGGSAGSTAGGIKNTTAGLLIMSTIRFIRRRSQLSIFGRTIPEQQITSAMSLLSIVVMFIVASSVIIALMQPDIAFSGILFEVISAITNNGSSLGVTASLAPVSLGILMLLMFFGRAGIMIFGITTFFNHYVEDKIKYPDSWIMMG